MKKLMLVLVFVLPFMLNAQQFASILKATGNVTIRAAGQPDFNLPAKLGMGLNSGDALKTDEDGFAAIIFTNDKSLLKIRKNSQIEIKDDYSTRTVKVTEGKMLAQVTPGIMTSYRIETPTSVASVKGTEFWVITSLMHGDRFYGIKGLVQVINLITGMESTLSPGQMIVSTPNGDLLVVPVDPEDIPQDEDSQQQQPQPPTGPGEETGEIPPSTPTPDAGAPVMTTEVAETVEPVEAGGEKPFGMGLGLGSVTIDGKIYNQISLRPELKLGKFGLGLDVALYLDESGKVRPDEWDEPIDYIDKFYYVRWGQPGDPFFIKAGALDNVTLGYGILLNGYSNTTEYPQVRKVGFHTGMQYKKIGWEAFLANAKEITGPGLLAGRLTYRMSESFPLTFGATVVLDANQYSGLRDSDGDGVPDPLDLFPGANDTSAVDSILAFIPSPAQRDYFRRLGMNIPSEEILASKQTTLDDLERDFAGAVAFDVGYPILNLKFLKLNLYGQVASFFPVTVTSIDEKEFTPGFGIAAPGVRMNLFNIADLGVEYRYAGENFIYSYWDRVYDFERIQIREVSGIKRLYTKEQMGLMNDAMQGVFGSFGVNILNYFMMGAYYQHMLSANNEVRSFMATASVPKGKIPKLAEAIAFYQRNNDSNPFDFKNPSENTILGYRVGFDIGGGAVLRYIYQMTYRDQDGNGRIDPKTESISLTTIETGFSF